MGHLSYKIGFCKLSHNCDVKNSQPGLSTISCKQILHSMVKLDNVRYTMAYITEECIINCWQQKNKSTTRKDIKTQKQ